MLVASIMDLFPVEIWAALIFGALTVGLVFLLGFQLLPKKKRPGDRSRPRLHRPKGRAVDPFVHGSTMEKRSSLRRKGTDVEVQLRDENLDEELGTAWVVDRS